MTTAALVLVLASAAVHATWNLLLKRATNPEAFTWLLLACMSVLLSPLAAVLAWKAPLAGPAWRFILGRSLMETAYFVLLSRGYARGDLSLVYPLARGTGLAVAATLGVLALQESLAPRGAVGIAAVATGIYLVQGWGRLARLHKERLGLPKDPGARYALLTGLIVGGYSAWDKVGVSHANPLLYIYLFSLGTTLWLSPYILRAHGWKRVQREWRAHGKEALAAALLSFGGYSMVLRALQLSQVSYVAPAREVSIVMGVALGSLVLKEPWRAGRFLGAGVIVTGVGLIATAR